MAPTPPPSPQLPPPSSPPYPPNMAPIPPPLPPSTPPPFAPNMAPIPPPSYPPPPPPSPIMPPQTPPPPSPPPYPPGMAPLPIPHSPPPYPPETAPKPPPTSPTCFQTTKTYNANSGTNWAYVPIPTPTTCNDLFNGINTNGINVYGKVNCFGRADGIGFDGGGNLLYPNEGYLIVDTLRDDNIIFSFCEIPISGTKTFDANSGTNWAYLPIRIPTTCNTLFNGINTNGINIYGNVNCFGRSDGIGFDGGGNLLLPHEGYLIIDTIRDDVLTLSYSM